MVLENKQLDKMVYQEELKEYLPKNIIDIHTHLWRKSDVGVIPVDPNAPVRWPSKVVEENTVEDFFYNNANELLENTRKTLYGRI